MSRKKEKGEAQLYLEQIEKYDLMIRNKQIEKAQMEDIALSVTSGGESTLVYVNDKNGKKGKYELQNMGKVQSSGGQQKMADAAIHGVDIGREIDKIIIKLHEARQDIIRTIELLDKDEYDVLHKRYIQGMTPDEIALKKGKSKSWVDTKHGRALQSVQKILDSRKTPVLTV